MTYNKSNYRQHVCSVLLQHGTLGHAKKGDHSQLDLYTFVICYTKEVKSPATTGYIHVFK